MIKIIKKILPKSVKRILINLRNNSNRLYRIDKTRFEKSAFDLIKNKTKENLEAKITFHYHSLEKGLSNTNFRIGFGETAYTQLIYSMEEYKKKGFETTLIPYKSGLSIISEYIIKHQNTGVDTSYLNRKLNELSMGQNIEDLCGVYELKSEEIISAKSSDFKNLALNRYSVRDYSEQEISIELINESIKLATKSPSVCNRQPWKIYVLRTKKIVDDVLNIQSGFTGHGHNIKYLLLICSNNNALSNYTERNQGYTDCGMFAMSLVYALEYNGLATCMLNANLNISADKKIRKLLNIPDSQNLVVFISVGNYPEKFKVPKSPRDDYKNKTYYL